MREKKREKRMVMFHGYEMHPEEAPIWCLIGHCWHGGFGNPCPHVTHVTIPEWVGKAWRRSQRTYNLRDKEPTRFTHNHHNRIPAKDGWLTTFREHGDKEPRYRNNDKYGHAWRCDCCLSRDHKYLTDEQAIAEGLADMHASWEEQWEVQDGIDWDAESDWILQSNEDDRAWEDEWLGFVVTEVTQDVDELADLMAQVPHGAPIRTGSYTNIAYAA